MKRVSRRAALRIGAATTLSGWLGSALPAIRVAAAPASQARVAIDLLHPWNGDNGGARAMNELARRYRVLRPDVDVRQQVVAGEDYERKQVAGFAAGKVPDLTLTFAEMLPSYAERGALTPLDDRIARDAISLADYFDVVVAQSSWAGHVFGLTHHPDLRALLY